ncbi:MAG: hypothetical protein U0802_06625 [Candidatus Binatia bacterium]
MEPAFALDAAIAYDVPARRGRCARACSAAHARRRWRSNPDDAGAARLLASAAPLPADGRPVAVVAVFEVLRDPAPPCWPPRCASSASDVPLVGRAG